MMRTGRNFVLIALACLPFVIGSPLTINSASSSSRKDLVPESEFSEAVAVLKQSDDVENFVPEDNASIGVPVKPGNSSVAAAADGDDRKPNKPAGKPSKPNKPSGKPQKPGKPNPQKPGKPKPQKPGKPKPQKPGGRPQKPAKPKPQKPGGKPNKPGKPQKPGKPAKPSRPQRPGGGKPAKPAKPGLLGEDYETTTEYYEFESTTYDYTDFEEGDDSTTIVPEFLPAEIDPLASDQQERLDSEIIVDAAVPSLIERRIQKTRPIVIPIVNSKRRPVFDDIPDFAVPT